MSSKMEAIKAAVDRLDTSECRGIVVNKEALAELRALVAAPVADGQGHVVAQVVDYIVQNPHQRLWYGPELGRLPVGTRLYLNPGEQPDVVALREDLANSAQSNARQAELLNALIRRMGFDGVAEITGCRHTHPKKDLEEMIASGVLLRELAEELGVSLKPVEAAVGA
jgi:hypothetical protein